MEKVFKFEIRYGGDCRGYYFRGYVDWESKDLFRGLEMIRCLDDDEECWEEMVGYEEEKLKEMKSIREVVDWLEDDCIGGGEEYLIEVRVNGEVVYYDEGSDRLDGVLNDGDYIDEEEIEKILGKGFFEKYWYISKEDRIREFWKIDKLEKMMK